jgi:hypothetical protein
MPPDERFRLDDGQQMPPLDEGRHGAERDACGVIGPAGLHPAFQVQGQLLPQEQVFGRELGT